MLAELFHGPCDGLVIEVDDDCQEQIVDFQPHPKATVIFRRRYYRTPYISPAGRTVFLYHSAVELVEA